MPSVVSNSRPSSPEILASYLLDQTDVKHSIASVAYRQQAIETWNIPQGSKVLEIGGGQGDFTVALADAVGPHGSVIGVDPSPPDWGKYLGVVTQHRPQHDLRNPESSCVHAGTPLIVEAQAHLAKCPLGDRITFINDDPTSYLAGLPETTTPTFDYIVFGHCIWFFPSPETFPEMLAKARPHARSVLVAEYSYRTSLPAAFPHVLAAQYNAVIEALFPERGIYNVRCALTPLQISSAIEQAGWAPAVTQEYVTPSAVLRDAWREVMMVTRSGMFRQHLDQAAGVSASTKTVLVAMRDAVQAGVDNLGGGVDGVRNMDAWVARFDL